MSGLTVTFWGTRGSIPTPGRSTEKYGGNTTCLELRCEDTLVVIDAGSGIRPLSDAWLTEFDMEPIRASILFTHAHWDHIQGFPFFLPAYQKKNAFTIYGEQKPSGSVGDLLRGQMGGDYFPIPLTAMQAELTFQNTADQFDIGTIQVRTQKLPHPGGSLGYRLEAGSATFVLATDSELDQVARNRAEVEANHSTPRSYAREFLDFFRDADMLVIDCQYTDEEYQRKRGWGHNSITTIVDLCRQVRPKIVALFHHDPQSHDEKVDDMVSETAERMTREARTETLVLAARELLTMRVGSSSRPLKAVGAG